MTLPLPTTALCVPDFLDVRVPLPRVVLLREGHQGHPVRFQAVHPGRCFEDLLHSARGALVGVQRLWVLPVQESQAELG